MGRGSGEVQGGDGAVGGNYITRSNPTAENTMIEEEKKRLSQEHTLALLAGHYGANDFVTVYLSDREGAKNHGIYCALVPSNIVDETLSRRGWVLRHGEGIPDAVIKYRDGKDLPPQYLRFGREDGVEPLVIDRYFHGIKPGYCELSEEFRLFHHLYHHQKSNKYYKIDDAGIEHLVATVGPNRISIRLIEIRQFLAIKEMHLAVQYDCRENSTWNLKELGLTKGGSEHEGDLCEWGLYYGDFGGLGDDQAFSRFLGKRYIPPFAKEKSGFWGFTESQSKECLEFIIGAEEDGNPILNTSNPDLLGNNFGANPHAPHYLTPVFFRKGVLDKYYQQPAKYQVEDGRLMCGGLWSVTIDNDHENKICMWLGDLGRDLPHLEQLHWRSYNILPEGGPSKTFFKRQIAAQFTDSEQIEHKFIRQYQELQRVCEECLGWQLVLPLATADEHHLKSIRVPSTDEQRDFDEVVLSLSKTLIDSLNVRQLNDIGGLTDSSGSIAKLEEALSNIGAKGFETHISFLRKLQDLRSSGAAHRKGKSYKRIATEFGSAEHGLREIVTQILFSSVELLEYLRCVIEGEVLKN